MNWSRCNWLDDIVLPLAISILRASWLWPWLELVRHWLAPSQPGPVLPLALLILVVLGGMATARRAPGAERSAAWEQAVATAIGLVAVLLVLWWQFFRSRYWPWDPHWLGALVVELRRWGPEMPVSFMALVAAAHLWWRGLRDGRRPLNGDDTWRAFATGLIGLALAFLAATANHSIPGGAVSLLLLFFTAGMVALAITSLELAPGLHLRGDQAQVATNRHWLGTVSLVILGLLGLGLLLSLLITPGALAGVLTRLAFIPAILGRILSYLILAISYVVFWLLDPLLRWLQARGNSGERPTGTQLPNWQEQLKELQQGTPPDSWGLEEALGWIGLGVLALAIVLLFAVALRRYRVEKEGEEVDETREGIFSLDLLQEQVNALWRDWLERLRRQRARVLGPFLSLEGQAPTRRAVRALYQALLAAASAHGRPRLRGQTPVEYRQALAQDLPATQDALGALTEQYLNARYAPEPPTPDGVERARRAWDGLQGEFDAQDKE